MAYFGRTRLIDEYGFSAEFSPRGDQRFVEPYKLCGTPFEGSTVDANFWTTSTSGGAAASQANGVAILDTGTSASSSGSFTSKKVARYYGGCANLFMGTVRIVTPEEGDGYFKWGVRNSTTDGAYFKSIDERLYATILSNSSEQDTLVYEVGTWDADNFKDYEIYYTSKSVYFVVNGEIVHTATSTTGVWTRVKTFNIFMEAVNVLNTGNPQVIHAAELSIFRLGKMNSNPTNYYHSGTTAGIIAKRGAGHLHSLVVGEVPTSGSVVTIYDGTSTGGTIVAKFTFAFPAGGNFNPVAIDFKNMPFNTGLFFVIATQSATVTLIYE